jgi:segregation and condensation protein B
MDSQTSNQHNQDILPRQIEAILFYKAEPVKKTAIADFLHITIDGLERALIELTSSLAGRGVQLLTTSEEIQLVTTPEFSEMLTTLRKEELSRDIGKAGAETLAIILYRGPLSRADIDRIRGVNSTFILRNLLIRGLIDRKDNPKDQRSLLYTTSPELLKHLGVTRREDLPDFSDIMNSLDAFEAESSSETRRAS